MRTKDIYQSSYLKAADVPQPITVTITGVTVEEFTNQETGETKEKPVLSFAELDKSWPVGPQQWGNLLLMLGETDNTAEWHGKQIQLYSAMTGLKKMGVMVRPAQTGSRTVTPPTPAVNAARNGADLDAIKKIIEQHKPDTQDIVALFGQPTIKGYIEAGGKLADARKMLEAKYAATAEQEADLSGLPF